MNAKEEYLLKASANDDMLYRYIKFMLEQVLNDPYCSQENKDKIMALWENPTKDKK